MEIEKRRQQVVSLCLSFFALEKSKINKGTTSVLSVLGKQTLSERLPLEENVKGYSRNMSLKRCIY